MAKKQRALQIALKVVLILVILTVFLIPFFHNPYEEPIVIIDAVIEQVWAPADGAGFYTLVVLADKFYYPEQRRTEARTVLPEEPERRGIFVRADTEICSDDNSTLSVADLKPGQRLQATLSPTVIYEPYNTYTDCYEIRIYGN